MAFIPVAVPPQRSASPRAQDLGRRLKAEVEKFEAQYPGTSREDLRAAAALAIGEESVTAPPRNRLAAVMAAGLAALGVIGFMAEAGGGDGTGSARWPVLAVAVAIACAAVLAAVIRRSRR